MQSHTCVRKTLPIPTVAFSWHWFVLPPVTPKPVDFWSYGSRLAQLPTRLSDRVIGTPSDGSRVRSTARTAGAGVPGASNSEVVVATLCVESIDCDGDVTAELNGA